MTECLHAPAQLDLFEHVAKAYLTTDDGLLDNSTLYRQVVARAGIAESALLHRVPVGRAGQAYNVLKRKVRWYQQTLKTIGLIEHVPNARGVWQLTGKGRQALKRALPETALVAFSTALGVAIWASSDRVFGRINEPIHLYLCSPPYPLQQPRAYGNPSEPEYVDFVCRILEPIVHNLVPGGSICLNISNDIFLPKSPARSLYRERLVIALHERLGLSKMDEFIWHNGSKPPAPVAWASKLRVQLNTAWEPIYWFTNDPAHVRSNNRRVLEPHTERHLKLIAEGGVKRIIANSDGAYRLRPGSYGAATPGRIPRNVLSYGHSCADQRAYKRNARELSLQAHGAAMPRSLVRFLIQFLTEQGDLVVDSLSGSQTTAIEAEDLGRRWLTTEWIWDYLRGGAERFREAAGYWLNPAFIACGADIVGA